MQYDINEDIITQIADENLHHLENGKHQMNEAADHNAQTTEIGSQQISSPADQETAPTTNYSKINNHSVKKYTFVKGRDNEAIIKLKLKIHPGNEDVCIYIQSQFNDSIDGFTIVNITKGSCYEDYNFKPNDVILVANFLGINNTNINKFKPQINKMYACANYVDYVIQKYTTEMWENNFKGDENIYDEIDEQLIGKLQQLFDKYPQLFTYIEN